jgi:hypothetical protein
VNAFDGAPTLIVKFGEHSEQLILEVLLAPLVQPHGESYDRPSSNERQEGMADL